MVAFMDLPPEVSERCLRYCDKATLASCCLVNTSTLSVARPQLFYSLVLDRSLLNGILNDKVPYLPLVRVMHAHIHECFGQEFNLLVEKLVGQVEGPLSFHVQAPVPLDSHIDAISNALVKVPQSSSFIVLHTNMSLDNSVLFSPWPSIASSVIKEVRILKSGHPNRRSKEIHRTRPVLETLRLEVLPPLDQIQEHLDLSHLKRLSLHPYMEGSAKELVSLAASSLEVLSIFGPSRGSHDIFPSGPHFDLFTNSDLKLPTLKSVLFWVGGSPRSIESWIVPMISNISVCALKLESLSISIWVGNNTEPEKEISMLWRPLFDSRSRLVKTLHNIKRLCQVELALDSVGLRMESLENRDELGTTIRRNLRDNQPYISFIWCCNWATLWPFFE
ncbi:hypothetical protein DL96DRAFT_1781287 [Flagelloscypha sp. PMI_526]|nr:hypothetical protein DL96DRAFT_1781287 [Flagelloscypha sp. PMI_526]